MLFIVGPAGSGKTLLVHSVAKTLSITVHEYDEYVEHGVMEGQTKHPWDDTLATFLLDNDKPAILIIDHWTENHVVFMENMMAEFNAHLTKIQNMNKMVIWLVNNLESFHVRKWIHTMNAPKMYMSTLCDKSMLSNWVMRNIGHVKPDHFISFTGDYRQLGMNIDLDSQKSIQVIRDNWINIFDLVKHCMGVPVSRVVRCNQPKSIIKMCVHNVTKYLDLKSIPEQKRLDINAQMHDFVSDGDMFIGSIESNESDECVVLEPGGRVQATDVSLLYFLMGMNLLKRHLRPIKPEFPPTKKFCAAPITHLQEVLNKCV